MIAHLSGTLLEKTSGHAVINASGVGYLVYSTSETLASLGEEGEVVSLWVHMVVRENVLDLYGFAHEEDKAFFELLIGVPGIGPKSALAVLSLASVNELTRSITAGDTTYLTRVSGIGKKTAEKIVLELKDKLGAEVEGGPNMKEQSDAIEALQSLGYSLKESRDALKKVGDDVEGTSERVRQALKLLGQK